MSAGRYSFQPVADPNGQQQPQQPQAYGQPQPQQAYQQQQQQQQPAYPGAPYQQQPPQQQQQQQYPPQQPGFSSFQAPPPVQQQQQQQQYGFPPQQPNYMGGSGGAVPGGDLSGQQLVYPSPMQSQGSFGQLPFMSSPSQMPHQHQHQHQQPPMQFSGGSAFPSQPQQGYPQQYVQPVVPQQMYAQPQFFPSGSPAPARPGPPPGAILSSDYSHEEFVPHGPPTIYRMYRSRVVGALVRGDSNDLGFIVFSIKLRDVSQFFDRNQLQPWNRNYDSAQKIFGSSIKSSAVRAGITIQHNTLYSGEDKLQESERELRSGDEFLRLVQYGEWNSIRRRFTYVIHTDETFRFSETGSAFFKDFASKHAVHSNGSTEVIYAGEFHIGKFLHPDGTAFRWLIIDNNSGTYAPNKALLPKLRALMAHNFPGLYVEALDFSDPALKEYMRRF